MPRVTVHTNMAILENSGFSGAMRPLNASGRLNNSSLPGFLHFTKVSFVGGQVVICSDILNNFSFRMLNFRMIC